jgi:hypothetical protein
MENFFCLIKINKEKFKKFLINIFFFFFNSCFKIFYLNHNLYLLFKLRLELRELFLDFLVSGFLF